MRSTLISTITTRGPSAGVVTANSYHNPRRRKPLLLRSKQRIRNNLLPSSKNNLHCEFDVIGLSAFKIQTPDPHPNVFSNNDGQLFSGSPNRFDSQGVQRILGSNNLGSDGILTKFLDKVLLHFVTRDRQQVVKTKSRLWVDIYKFKVADLQV